MRRHCHCKMTPVHSKSLLQVWRFLISILHLIAPTYTKRLEESATMIGSLGFGTETVNGTVSCRMTLKKHGGKDFASVVAHFTSCESESLPRRYRSLASCCGVVCVVVVLLANARTNGRNRNWHGIQRNASGITTRIRLAFSHTSSEISWLSKGEIEFRPIEIIT